MFGGKSLTHPLPMAPPRGNQKTTIKAPFVKAPFTLTAQDVWKVRGQLSVQATANKVTA